MVETRCGYVAIIGRPNVGKSTLMNHLLGQKLSITSRKPQTTRHQLLGIKTVGDTQLIFVDTPGLHQGQSSALNRYLNRAALSSLTGVDIVVWLLEAQKWTTEDTKVLEAVQQSQVPVILAINKVDKLADKTQLLPFLEQQAQRHTFLGIFPISALKGTNLDQLEQTLCQHLPQSQWFFAPDQLTDRSERFLAAEIVREKLVRRLGDELPYRLSVQIEHFKEEDTLTHIAAMIWVERASQKGIVIGKQGSMLKSIGEAARHDLEQVLGRKIYLQLWVKVKEGWYDDERALRQLGYFEE